MGPLFNQDRLSNTVQRTASAVRGSYILPAISELSSGRRSRQPPFKRGSGGNLAGEPRFLFQNFPCSKKERETQTDYRFIYPKSLCVRSKFQNGNTKKGQKGCQPKRLGFLSGPNGCLSACTNSSKVSQVSPFHSERQGLSVQGSSVRSFNKPLHLHHPYESGGCFLKEKGDFSSSIPRRLVSKKPKSSNSVGTQTFYNVPDQFSWSDDQLREIRSESIPNICLHWDGISNQSKYCQSSSTKGPEIVRNNSGIFSKVICISQGFPIPFGTDQCSSRFCKSGQAASQAIANATTITMACSDTPITLSSQSDRRYLTPSQLVEERQNLSARCPLEDRTANSYNILRCQPGRLGVPCGTRGTYVSWALDGRPIPAPHKHVGNVGHSFISKESSSGSQEFYCPGGHGQYNSSGLFKPSGGNSFTRLVCSGLEHSDLVLSAQNSAISKTYPWQVQYSCRSIESNQQTNLDRMGSESRNSECYIPNDRVSQYRLVCNTSKPQASSVCISDTRSESSGYRRTDDGLESCSRLCVSSFSPNSIGDKQNKIISVQSSIDSSSVAQQTVVSRTALSSGLTTNISTNNPKPPTSTKRKVLASKHSTSSSARLGIIKQSIRNQEFSEEVAEHVSKARRESTRKVYEAKWQIFLDWADQRKVDPIQASPTMIADFLTFLFTKKKCQVSTIKGYRSMISNTLKFSAGYDIGSHPVLSELIRSFQRQRPVERSLAPKWDLAFVLAHLCKAPFEPLSRASLFHLSIKTAFLLTMATARRVSEVHAFSIDKDHLRFNRLDGSLTLRTQVGFLAKNQIPSKAPDSINIPKLSNFCHSNDYNVKLCPIRAVKIYLNKTRSIRKGRNRLFIPIKGDHDLKKSSISTWVKYTIRHAYNSISKTQSKLLKIKAHELRALSTSWAYFNFIPIEEIIKAAVWSKSSTFASHYLRDFNAQSENLQRLGPMVVSQKLVGGIDKQVPHCDD